MCTDQVGNKDVPRCENIDNQKGKHVLKGDRT